MGRTGKMKIYDFEIIDRCLYDKKNKTIIIGDLHLGYEESLNNKGYSFPRSQLTETLLILEKIFNKIKKTQKIIILGDVKHYFGKILQQESKDFKDLYNFLVTKLEKKGEIIITKGNHDKILEPLITNYSNIELVDYYIFNKVIYFHGDKFSLKKCENIIKDKKIELIIIGHFHPALVLNDKDQTKQEKYKCFVYGKSSLYKKETIFVPSFFPLIEGSDIKKEIEIYENGMKVVALSDTGELYKFNKI